jgi:hypothetical protein
MIRKVVETLGLSYHTTRELNEIIDNNLPGHPSFQCKELTIGNEQLQFYCRDILECIRTLYGNPEFTSEMVFSPERYYTSHERTSRIYNEMHTCDWWWEMQVCHLTLNETRYSLRYQATLESRQPGATIIPIILSSDKTQLTLFRGKMAYPVYFTIGNIPKRIRRKPSYHAQLLIAYIPTTKLECMTNKAARRRALANLFHGCMQDVLAPITSCGEDGVPMMSGDGIWRRCHPIFAVYIGDYPEQVLVTCTYSGHCPKCKVTPDQLGEYETYPSRDHHSAIGTYRLADDSIRTFYLACREAALKPVFHPFWDDLPLADVYQSVTPDVLHQLLQGVMKHLISWLTRIFGPTEIDARCRALPPNHHIMLFPKGITSRSRVSGLEHKNMCRILLGLIVDLPVPGGQVSSRVVKAVRALLDFLYVAQYPSHTTDTLLCLEACLSRFHANKDAFIDLGVRDHFNIPKIHSLLHYKSSIKLFGTTDNYNTEQTERLHIDFTKDAYRATNHKDEYTQMTTWLERREKIQQHEGFIKWHQSHQEQVVHSLTRIGPPQPDACCLKMALHPSVKAASFDDLTTKYGAQQFLDTLADFIAHTNNPGASAVALRNQAANILIPFRAVPVFHKIKFTSISNSNNSEIIDAIHVRPEQRDLNGQIIPARFDTVLVHSRQQDNMHRSKGESGLYLLVRSAYFGFR